MVKGDVFKKVNIIVIGVFKVVVEVIEKVGGKVILIGFVGMEKVE